MLPSPQSCSQSCCTASPAARLQVKAELTQLCFQIVEAFLQLVELRAELLKFLFKLRDARRRARRRVGSGIQGWLAGEQVRVAGFFLTGLPGQFPGQRAR